MIVTRRHTIIVYKIFDMFKLFEKKEKSEEVEEVVTIPQATDAHARATDQRKIIEIETVKQQRKTVNRFIEDEIKKVNFTARFYASEYENRLRSSVIKELESLGYNLTSIASSYSASIKEISWVDASPQKLKGV